MDRLYERILVLLDGSELAQIALTYAKNWLEEWAKMFFEEDKN